MLVMVPLPVVEIDAVPGPKYSMMRLVPPLTVRMPRSLRMTSLGDGPTVQTAGEFDADDLRLQDLPVEPGHDIHRVRTADADRDHAETTCVGCVGIGADHHPARKGVFFEHDLVDDARSPGFQKPMP